jgi:hypothetical protein
MFAYVHEGALAFVHFSQLKKSDAERETPWGLLSSSCLRSPLLLCVGLLA